MHAAIILAGKVVVCFSNSQLSLLTVYCQSHPRLTDAQGWLVGWLVSLFFQGKPLASGYYSRNSEKTIHQKDKDKDKTYKVQKQV